MELIDHCAVMRMASFRRPRRERAPLPALRAHADQQDLASAGVQEKSKEHGE